MVVHKASFYRWYANTRISCGKNRNTLALTPINAQSYQGTRVVRASSLRNTAGQRSRWSSVFTGGNDCCRASRIWWSSCSVISLLSSSFPQGLTPTWFKCLRRMRTARKTRSFTAPTDVPKASAIAASGRSSTSASVAAHLQLCRQAAKCLLDLFPCLLLEEVIWRIRCDRFCEQTLFWVFAAEMVERQVGGDPPSPGG